MKYYKLVGKGWEWLETNKIYKDNYVSKKGYKITTGIQSNSKDFIEVTKEEYDKQEKIIIPKLKFKVGDKIKHIEYAGDIGEGVMLSWAIENLTISNIYTVKTIDPDDLTLKESEIHCYYNVKQFELVTPKHNKTTQVIMNKEIFSIGGSAILREALVKESECELYTTESIKDYKYLQPVPARDWF